MFNAPLLASGSEAAHRMYGQGFLPWRLAKTGISPISGLVFGRHRCGARIGRDERWLPSPRALSWPLRPNTYALPNGV